MRPEILSILNAAGCSFYHTGSRAICSPAPMDTDDDWLVLCKNISHLVDTVQMLDNSGWVRGGSEVPESEFIAFRKEEVNLIVTNSTWFYDKYREATVLSKKLNLLNKEDRIAVFSTLLNRKPN